MSEATLKILHEKSVRLVLLRCAGYNNVDLEKAAAYDICVMRVPGYSPEAVAEHAMALALACNRRLYKAYNKVRENDFSLAGLMGFNFYGKIAGIIGTGRIGAAMCRICNGFGMKVIAYDVYENPDLKDFVTYVTLDELLAQSDLISLHCPLMDSTYHLIQLDTINVTVQHHRFSFGEPLPYLRRGVGAVARKNQRHEVGIDLLHAAEFAAQEPGDQLAVYGRIEAREMHILALDAPVGKQLAQHAYLGRFARSVQSFEYNEHRLPVLFPFVVVMVVSSSQRSIRTARSTPSASASASACVL